VVGRREDLAVDEVELEAVSFISGAEPEPLECSARLRYHACPIAASYRAGRLRLEEPFYGAAPGQAAVMYDGTRVLGGGLIRRAA
jgi:tRNA-specific 2-thiouridylase